MPLSQGRGRIFLPSDNIDDFLFLCFLSLFLLNLLPVLFVIFQYLWDRVVVCHKFVFGIEIFSVSHHIVCVPHSPEGCFGILVSLVYRRRLCADCFLACCVLLGLSAWPSWVFMFMMMTITGAIAYVMVTSITKNHSAGTQAASTTQQAAKSILHM